MDYCRLKARDKDKSLRTDAELIEDINEAVDEAYLRSDSLYETVQTAITPTTVQASQVEYDIDAATLQMHSVRLVDPTDSNNNNVLIPSTVEEMYSLNPQWQDKAGKPTHFITDWYPKKLRFYPLPTTAQQDVGLTIECWRSYTGSKLTAPSDVPLVDPLNHRQLHEWVLYRIFSDHDLDTYDPARGQAHLAHFEEMFGCRPSAKSMRLRESYKGTIKPRFTVDGSDYGRDYWWIK